MFLFPFVGWAIFKTEDPKRRSAMLAGLAVAGLAAFIAFGAVTQREGVLGAWDLHHFSVSERDHRRHEDAYAVFQHIPPNAKVSASERLNPHLSSRADVYTLRFAILDADYVIFDMATFGGNERTNVKAAVDKGEFGLLAQQGDFWLLKRGHDTADNAKMTFLR
jgi:hypothetical protein